MSATQAAIELRSVTKTFGGTTAVANLDLTVPRGALYGFIGPNGAGKTTSIRMIMSILFPDSGELTVLGHPSAHFVAHHLYAFARKAPGDARSGSPARDARERARARTGTAQRAQRS